jgi:predicted transcriptional regulator
LVEETFSVRVQTPVTVPFTIVMNENGMQAEEVQHHIEFMVNTTFRVKTVSQLEKEKKKVVEVTHSGYDIYADYDSKDMCL